MAETEINPDPAYFSGTNASPLFGFIGTTS
jgi:hypothetical protein